MKFKKAIAERDGHIKSTEYIFNKIRDEKKTHQELLNLLSESDKGNIPLYTTTPLSKLPRWAKTYLWGYRDALHHQNEELIDSRWAENGTEEPLTHQDIISKNLLWQNLYYLGTFWQGTDKPYSKFNNTCNLKGDIP